MRLFLLTGILGACGRLDFAPIADGHDEDGDGVADAIDVCPHRAGSQLDTDGDGIGDDCDPEPTLARQHVLLFATMQPGDQPFALNAFSPGAAGAS
jgi:hypothetical protein